MEFNKPVSNPMLVGCIELLKAEDSAGHRNMFVEELMKAVFQSPAIIDPEPAEDAEGKLVVAPNSKVQFPMLIAPDGKKFFMAFTDSGEYRKWAEKNKDLPYFALKFDDYARMLFHKDAMGNDCPALGIVINPMAASMVVPKEMVAGILAARMTQAKQKAMQRTENPMGTMGGGPIPKSPDETK